MLEAGELLGQAAINLTEASKTLRRLLDALDIEPARQDEIERRAATLEALARKHRLAVGELPAQLARVARDLAALENVEQNLAAVEERLGALDGEYRALAAQLTRARAAAAQALSSQITGLMQALGMAGGRFEAAVATNDAQFSAYGADEVEFLVSANPGQAPKALAKVASGGELSRISLAIQVAAAGSTGAPCMVFDEVDAGIGGAVAEIVGRQLRALGERGQVLCVTHLPQVASQAHHQYRVTKLTDGKITRTTVKRLSAPERVEEIARMLGGIDISEQARAHARDMLARTLPAPAAKKSRSRS
jgi:DNA repair protein RecN (Recombination protein N)